MPQILHGAHRTAILRVTDFDSAVHILQTDVCAAASKLSAQGMSHEIVMVYVQSEIVVNPASCAAETFCATSSSVSPWP